MSEPFMGEVKLIGFSFAPENWAYCDGQSLPISQNTALFSLVGIQFGGDGRTNFNLPDLRGRTPVHSDHSSYHQGLKYGVETVTLTAAEMGYHTHALMANTTDGTTYRPRPTQTKTFAKAYDAAMGNLLIYRQPLNLTQLNPGTCSRVGGSQPHNNIQPSVVVGFVMALTGLYPSRN